MTSSVSRDVLSRATTEARKNAVPQIGPEVPPMRPVIIMATAFRRFPTFERSMSSTESSTTSKPRAIE